LPTKADDGRVSTLLATCVALGRHGFVLYGDGQVINQGHALNR